MLPGPLFRIEMLTGSRRARLFVLRGLYATALLVALYVVYETSSGYQAEMDIQQAASLAGSFFVSFAWLQLIAILAVGPALAAGAIAIERERRTIEYMLASDLTNAEIVLGKLTARLVHLAYLVLVGLPVLALFGLLGGISDELLAADFLITLSTMAVIAVGSIAVSVASRRARDAVVRAYLVLAVVFITPLFAAWWLTGSEGEWLLAINPLWILGRMTFEGVLGQNVPWREIGVMVAAHAAFALAAGLWATLCVRRLHLRDAGRSEKRRAMNLDMLRIRRPIGAKPMLWKELYARQARVRLGILGSLALLTLCGCLVAYAVYQFVHAQVIMPSAWQAPLAYYVGSTIPATLFAACGVLLLIGAIGAGSMTSERERDTWLTLISTPLDGREIVTAKLWGTVYAARWPSAIVMGVWALGVLLEPAYLIALLFAVATFGILAVYAASLGVYVSVRSKSTLKAMATTLTILCVVGGLYAFCCIPLMWGAGEGAAFCYAPAVPFLLAVPHYLYPGKGPGDLPGEVVAAWMIGVIGYGVAALVLTTAAVESFNQFSGRTHPRRGNVR